MKEIEQRVRTIIIQILINQAPIIQKYKEDYERVSSVHAHLTKQLEGAMRECDALKSEVSRLRRENVTLDKGNLFNEHS
jgi:hypothetical protein